MDVAVQEALSKFKAIQNCTDIFVAEKTDTNSSVGRDKDLVENTHKGTVRRVYSAVAAWNLCLGHTLPNTTVKRHVHNGLSPHI